MNGFQIPIHQALTQPILIGGLPREFAILTGTITAATVIGMHSFGGLLVGAVVFVVGRLLAKDDPQFLQTFKRHIHERAYYEV